MALCDDLLSPERARLTRFSFDGLKLDYDDRSDAGTDQLESARDFVQSVQDYIYARAEQLALVRQKAGMLPARSKAEVGDWRRADRAFACEYPTESTKVWLLIHGSKWHQRPH